ncbi:MAG TPA: sensor domain-containing diguanylate cyclase [Tepidiformaceae bacterium]|nr:sensor domain-containing diguanylate cyclase [Tepidiformaceae bacterium]
MGRPLTGQTDFIALLTDPDLLQLMLFACPDGVIVTDQAGDIALFAGASEAMFGYEPVEVMGRSFRTLIADAQSHRRLRDQLDRHTTVSNMEVLAARKGGGRFSAAFSAAVMRDRYGCILGTVYYVRDHSSVREIEDALRSKNAQLNHLVSKLDHLAHHDQLTGLLRRGSAMEEAEDVLLASGLERPNFGVAVFDLDHFKLVNDSYGHLIGDKVLTSVGAALRKVARHGDIVGRLGGEEFVAFLPGADLAAVAAFAERARAAIEGTRILLSDGLTVSVTTSGGVAAIPQCADSLIDALRIADDRLYAAKRAGRNRIISDDINRDDNRSAA